MYYLSGALNVTGKGSGPHCRKQVSEPQTCDLFRRVADMADHASPPTDSLSGHPSLLVCIFAQRHMSGEACMRKYSGEKSTKCNQCEYGSSKKGSLKAHLKVHGGEPSNKFKRCEYAPLHAYNLRVNLKTHKREYLYKCKHCDFALSG